ncbi:CASP8-associated protein 2 [Nibea albiflora]|uniref:CASP8-associated protein 2 n=1 Tax=Nibea albiflora TaxID=240163 RepID=A0ACB7F9P9_NIBAL|nr:CASP8-associated protein 2 [Nibea albiflora]
MLQSSLASQRTYSILADDLAVSLTIPSPLKSDSHLSFLQPSSMHIMSTPDSVISAHISEDALMDGEDATEQDIHLALDTDNSSCGSSSSVDSEPLATPFVFKPDLPMQALVMERSNDHFIVKIRQAATGADTTLTADDSLSRTLTLEDQQHGEDSETVQESQAKAVPSDSSQNGTPSNAVPSDNPEESSRVCQAATGSDLTQEESLTLTKDPPIRKGVKSSQRNTSKDSRKLSESQKSLSEITSDNCLHSSAQSSDQSVRRENLTDTADKGIGQLCHTEEDITTQQSPSEALLSKSDNSPHQPAESAGTNQSCQVLASHVSASARGDMEVSGGLTLTNITPEKGSSSSNKRKKHQEKSKAKRSRMEEEDSVEETFFNCKKDDGDSRSSPSSLSPSSLSAKNVIRKKGEVVMSWSRDEDRTILIELKMKGASRETFSALAERLNKPSGQIAHRFYQLMKLFKKQEKMDT